MKLTVIGSGYVGLVTGACLADIGNQVICVDHDQNKIDQLNNNIVPIYEPGLGEIISSNKIAGRIQFSTDVRSAIFHGDILFIAVGTPQGKDGAADLENVISAASNIGRFINKYKVIINKSTVPVGTADYVSAVIADELKISNRSVEYSVVSNPEFLKEGAAIEDFMRPERIIVGTFNNQLGHRAKKLVKKLYAPLNQSHDRTIYMNVRSAELTKYASNAMLATRISFMNELANLAESVGADIDEVRKGIGSDSRIGKSFLYAGTGYGGSCFPKDVRALIKTGEENFHDLKILRSVDDINESQKVILVKKIIERFESDLSGKTFAIWGLAFKPNTDDMREAPSRRIISELIKHGARVQAYDPVAIENMQKCIKTDFKDSIDLLKHITFGADMDSVLVDADALILVTEWQLFISPDFTRVKKLLKTPIIFDGRNIYSAEQMIIKGFEYHGIGRGYLRENL